MDILRREYVNRVLDAGAYVFNQKVGIVIPNDFVEPDTFTD
jgi:hypothetical protein